MVDWVMALRGHAVYLLAPVVRGRKGEYRKELPADYLKRGFPAGEDRRRFYETPEAPARQSSTTTSTVVTDRGAPDIATRLADSRRPR
jgi:excinuclease ABC subunit A